MSTPVYVPDKEELTDAVLGFMKEVGLSMKLSSFGSEIGKF